MLYNIRPWLSLSNYRSSLDAALMEQHQIGAILHLAENVRHVNIITLYLPVQDGATIQQDHLTQAEQFITEQIHDGQRILIACGAGISRSTAFAMLALKAIEGIPLLDAYLTIRQVNPQAMPHPALLESLCTYYEDEAGNLGTLQQTLMKFSL